jgi:hypothetical protein
MARADTFPFQTFLIRLPLLPQPAQPQFPPGKLTPVALLHAALKTPALLHAALKTPVPPHGVLKTPAPRWATPRLPAPPQAEALSHPMYKSALRVARSTTTAMMAKS